MSAEKTNLAYDPPPPCRTACRGLETRRSEMHMDRRPPGIGPESEDNHERPRDAEPSAPPAPLTEAEWDRILPPIDEGDPKRQAYVKEKIREALDDPQPDISADEAFAQVYAHIESRRAARRRGD